MLMQLLTFPLLQDHLIEFDAGWLLSNGVMDVFRSKFVQTNEVVDRLAAGLDAKGRIAISDIEPLTVNGAEADGKLFRVHLCRNTSRMRCGQGRDQSAGQGGGQGGGQGVRVAVVVCC